MERPKRFNAVLWCIGTALVSWLAVCELDRIASDRLFLVGMSFESEASVPELYDARASAAEWRLPAIGGVVLTAVLLAGLNWKQPVPSALPRKLVLTFLLSAALDLATTVWFFHMDGIDHELHPAIRLFGYAYGRTIGPILGKGVQAAGVLFIASKLPRLAKPLLIAASSIYSLAAIYNMIN